MDHRLILDAVFLALRIVRARQYRNSVIRHGVRVAPEQGCQDPRRPAQPWTIALPHDRSQRITSTTNAQRHLERHALAYNSRNACQLLVFREIAFANFAVLFAFGSASNQGYSPVLCPSVVMVVSPRKHELDVLHVVSVEGLPVLTSNFVGLVELSCVLLTAPERMCWRCPGVLWQLAQRVVGRILVLGPRLLKTFDLCIVLVLPPLHSMQNDSF